MRRWCLGRWLGRIEAIRELYGPRGVEQRDFIDKYGFWAVVLGAITPLPYSFTCWSAGALGVHWAKVLAASLLFRIPRLILYYLLIASAERLFI